MPTFELTVRTPSGGEQKVIVRAVNRRNAEAMAEAQPGSKVLGGRHLPSLSSVVADAKPLCDSLAGIAACARSMVRLCVSNPDRFHCNMVDELRLTLFEPVPGKPGEVISTLFRPTGEFDLEVRMSASFEGPHQVTVYFDGIRVAWCRPKGGLTVSAPGPDDRRTGAVESPPWTVDQGASALWASGMGLAPDDTAGAFREIEAAALVAQGQLAELVQYAQAERSAEC